MKKNAQNRTQRLRREEESLQYGSNSHSHRWSGETSIESKPFPLGACGTYRQGGNPNPTLRRGDTTPVPSALSLQEIGGILSQRLKKAKTDLRRNAVEHAKHLEEFERKYQQKRTEIEREIQEIEELQNQLTSGTTLKS